MIDQVNWFHVGVAFVVGALAKVCGTTMFLYLKSTFLPYVADRTYKHIDLSDDDWRILHSGDPINGEKLESEWKTTMKLRQTGEKLSGEALTNCTKGSKEGTQRQFIVTGIVNNGVVSLTMRNKDRSIKSHSTFLLQLIGEGAVLDGYRLFYGMNKNEINGTRCNLVRGKSMETSDCGSS